jgi:hypothetical protein
MLKCCDTLVGAFGLNDVAKRCIVHVLVLIVVEGYRGKLDMSRQSRARTAGGPVCIIVSGMSTHLTNGTWHAKCGTQTVLRPPTSLLGYLILITNGSTDCCCQTNHEDQNDDVNQ